MNRHVKQGVCASGSEAWLTLGTELLDEKHVAALYAIKSDVTECAVRCSEMFKVWLDRQPEASWRRLIVAMKNVHMIKLASDIEKLFSIDQTNKVGITADLLQGGQRTQSSLDSGMFCFIP